ncbi:MAG: phospholipid carrier-dependent glycosyltransferase [Fuerstia sp.]|nr:phospholipid carrier-dependent glycosyltransferase [Fuerstiella sp.]
MVAALPVLAVGYQADWTGFHEGPGARSEFPLGDAFIKANGKEVVPLVFYARWACIPFSLIGALFAYRWARELYSPAAGLVALILFVFEPNLLAHGELITPDGACTSFGIVAGYTFWRWLKQPTWMRAALTGGALGLAELSKMSWLILFGLWPMLWLIWRWLEPKKVECRESEGTSQTENVIAASSSSHQPSTINHQPSAPQLATILLLAVYLMNLGYGFDGTGTPLKEFQFVSTSLAGLEKPGTPGNRFRDTWLGQIPMPLPKQYILGFDNQKKDFEEFGHRSCLRGEWRDEGWWYYYLYGLLVKVPSGTWALFAFVIICRLVQRSRPVPLRDELVLLTPAIALLALVSSQTEFSIHLRYVFPALGLSLIFISQVGLLLTCPTHIHPKRERGSRPAVPCSRCGLVWVKRFLPLALTCLTPVRSLLVCVAMAYSVASGLLVYPHHLAYFNDFVGGPRNGHKHLLGSSLDWGQGTHAAIAWIKDHEPSSRVEFAMWSGTLATVLLSQPPDTITDTNFGTARTSKLILFSADRFSDRGPYSRSNQNQPVEEVVKRFASGSVLVRVKQPVDSQ